VFWRLDLYPWSFVRTIDQGIEGGLILTILDNVVPKLRPGHGAEIGLAHGKFDAPAELISTINSLSANTMMFWLRSSNRTM
jgi:hypothetical protein